MGVIYTILAATSNSSLILKIWGKDEEKCV